jgi:hypothetical protein
MTTLIRPIVNLNGSSVADLVDPRREAMDHLMDAIEALKRAAPNGRDYPGDWDRCAEDRAAHYARIGAIKAIREAVYAEAIHIKAQEA